MKQISLSKKRGRIAIFFKKNYTSFKKNRSLTRNTDEFIFILLKSIFQNHFLK